MRKNIFLIGFMGTGKTTVSQSLSRKLNFGELDLDQEIEKRKGQSIREIFESEGEEAFRRLETDVLLETKGISRTVVSCGGGAALRIRNVEAMKENGRVVLLTAGPETVLERVKCRTNRPLLNGHMELQYIEDLMAQRRDAYLSAADFEVLTDGRKPEEIAQEIIEKLKIEKMKKSSLHLNKKCDILSEL